MPIDEKAFLSACIEIEAGRVPPTKEESAWFRYVVERYEAYKAAKAPCSTEGVAKPTRIQELEVFLVQIYEALRSKKIRDLDTNWRMTEQVMPPSLECLHGKDSAEISGAYRKIHLSDVLSAARELINLYWKQPSPASAMTGEPPAGYQWVLVPESEVEGWTHAYYGEETHDAD